MEYEEVNPNANRKYNILNRLVFKPVMEWSEEVIKPTVCVGTTTGEFVYGTWTGYDYTQAEIYCENLKVLNVAAYHDGPVCSIDRWPVSKDLLLTTGGKIFCIWQEDFIGRPLLWRKSSGNVRFAYILLICLYFVDLLL